MRRKYFSLIKLILFAVVVVICTTFMYNILLKPNEEIRYLKPKEINPKFAQLSDVESHLENTEKIDWHDYELIKRESKRSGRGEQGEAAYLTPEENKSYDKLLQVNGFNAALSDKISIFRAVKDIRHPDCKKKKYLKNLKKVSVIVPFYEEHWSTLLRTTQSVITRTPPDLLAEIILVDDGSTKEFLKQKLDEYVKANMTKVKVIHKPTREGLIRTRLIGANVAVGDILIFLDSHTEVSINWLPPLIEPIVQDYRTCVCPFIDVIDHDTFEYRSQDEGARGAFDWEFYYKRLPLLPEDLKHPTEPFKSPVMAGGLFAISAKFFKELGGYDEGLMIWGGEQYELSFKIWQCGGIMVDAPCSRVGHIYRKTSPFPNPGIGDFVAKNYRRVAEVWMDEYAEYLYKRNERWRSVDPGDLTKQKNLRAQLKCKPFKWFMENVAFDLPKKYPLVEPGDFSVGKIRNVAASELCVDPLRKTADTKVSLNQCLPNGRTGQDFRMTWQRDIRLKGSTLCLDVPGSGKKAEIILFGCHGSQGNQLWKYDAERQWLVQGGNPRCLDCDPGSKELFVTSCDETSPTQKWNIENIDFNVIKTWKAMGLL